MRFTAAQPAGRGGQRRRRASQAAGNAAPAALGEACRRTVAERGSANTSWVSCNTASARRALLRHEARRRDWSGRRRAAAAAAGATRLQVRRGLGHWPAREAAARQLRAVKTPQEPSPAAGACGSGRSRGRPWQPPHLELQSGAATPAGRLPVRRESIVSCTASARWTGAPPPPQLPPQRHLHQSGKACKFRLKVSTTSLRPMVLATGGAGPFCNDRGHQFFHPWWAGPVSNHAVFWLADAKQLTRESLGIRGGQVRQPLSDSAGHRAVATNQHLQYHSTRLLKDTAAASARRLVDHSARASSPRKVRCTHSPCWRLTVKPFSVEFLWRTCACTLPTCAGRRRASQHDSYLSQLRQRGRIVGTRQRDAWLTAQ